MGLKAAIIILFLCASIITLTEGNYRDDSHGKAKRTLARLMLFFPRMRFQKQLQLHAAK